MQLEKFVTDWYTFYCKPLKINELKNCVIYISAYNIECFKKTVNDIMNNNSLSKFQKEIELESFAEIIAFIKRNSKALNEEVVQTEELLFIKENNSYIVVVKETKDIRNLKKELETINIDRDVNESIFIAIAEESQLITIKDTTCDLIRDFELPVFCLNIKE